MLVTSIEYSGYEFNKTLKTTCSDLALNHVKNFKILLTNARVVERFASKQALLLRDVLASFLCLYFVVFVN